MASVASVATRSESQSGARARSVGFGSGFAASVGVRAEDLVAGAGPQALPDRDVDLVLDEPDAAVAEQRVDAAGMLAAGRDVQRELEPERVFPVAVRQAAPAVLALVV